MTDLTNNTTSSNNTILFLRIADKFAAKVDRINKFYVCRSDIIVSFTDGKSTKVSFSSNLSAQNAMREITLF